MEWGKLLNLSRLNDSHYVQHGHRTAYAQDIDRILFSAPFRRLANKTQVHPLYDNDHLHHRLIHSFEVASVGRSLGTEVGAWLADERKEINPAEVEIIAGLVQTACMAHDIGNPPFGHSGEDAIAAWFKEKFSDSRGVLNEISKSDRVEFEEFEGNAQGFRILTRTEMYKNNGGMRLTLGALGAFTKYPVSAYVKRNIESQAEGTKYIGLKKYGFFSNDIDTFQLVAEKLEIPHETKFNSSGERVGVWWRRHPLAFLMEAADDICYNIMDLEDAYLAKNVSFEEVKGLLDAVLNPTNKEYPDKNADDVISRCRALAIKAGIDACVEAFKDNYFSIMKGEFASSLLDVSSKSSEFSHIKRIARNKIFNATRKTELEVYGRNVVYRTLNGIFPLINEIREKNWDVSNLSAYNVQLARAIGFPIDSFENSYEALHALTDFVSGMTDRYAVKIANMVSC